MKVIFLDIDGVMNSRADRFSLTLSTEFHFHILKSIIDATGAKIVLSSTWRISEDSRNVVQKRLNEFGMEFIDYTPTIKHGMCYRGEEIRDWLNNAPEPVESFVILDDERDMCEFTETNLVKTDIEIGLTISLAREAIRILNNERVEW